MNVSTKLIKVFGMWGDQRCDVEGRMDSPTGFVYMLCVDIKFKIILFYKQREFSLRFT